MSVRVKGSKLEASGYLAVARRWWWALVIATWAAGLAGYLVSSSIQPTYEGEAKLLVGPVVGTSDVLRAAASISNTYAVLATSKAVLDAARSEVNLPANTHLETRAIPDETTRILSIRAQYGDARKAAEIANAMAAQLMALRPTGVQLPEGQLQVIEAAQAPTAPIAPQPTLIAVIAALIGLLATGALVTLVEYLRSRVNSAKELGEMTRAPVFGFTSRRRRFRSTPQAPVVTRAEPNSRAAANARLLAMKIVYSEVQNPLSSVLVVGTARYDGSADLAGNIGAALAASGRRVILVDVNEEFGELTALFGLQTRAGDLLLDADNTIHAQSIAGLKGLELIPAGRSGSAELVDPETARLVLERLAKGRELVVLHAAPIHLAASTLAWSQVVDGTVLVVERERSKRADAAFAAENLRSIGARFLGSVLVVHAPRSRRRRATMPDPGAAQAARDGAVATRLRRHVGPTAATEARPSDEPMPVRRDVTRPE